MSRGRPRPARAASPKERAAAALFRSKSLGDVLGWLRHWGVPSRDRGDVAQDVWLAAVRSWHTYDPMKGPPVPWLYRITAYTALRYFGCARTRRVTLTAAPLAPSVPDPAPLASELLAAAQMEAELLGAIDAVDPGLRSMIIAHGINGMPVSQFAKSCGIHLSAGYRRRRKAWSQLRAEMQRREGGLPDDQKYQQTMRDAIRGAIFSYARRW